MSSLYSAQLTIGLHCTNITTNMPPFPSFTTTWHTSSYNKISPTRPELSTANKVVVITGGVSILSVFSLASKIHGLRRTMEFLDNHFIRF